MITTELNKQLHALLTQTNLMHAKAMIVASHTSGRSESSRDLKNNEAIEIIRYLKGVQTQQKLKELQSQQPHSNPNHISNAMQKVKIETPYEQANRMRRKIIALAHQMGWSTKHPVSGNKIADIARIDAWCKKFGHVKKTFNSYTVQELPMLVTQFEEMFKDFVNAI